MIKTIFNSFGRTFGRILCYIFIGFLLFVLMSFLKGGIEWETIKENLFSFLLY